MENDKKAQEALEEIEKILDEVPDVVVEEN